jgi:hypothetical protein
MPSSPIIAIAIGPAFLGKALYELATRKAFGRTGPLRRDDNPWGYWIVVWTSVLVGAFGLYLGFTRIGSV